MLRTVADFWFAHHPHVSARRTRQVRHFIGLVAGLSVMLLGSTMGINAADWIASLPVHVPHPLWDALAYGLHGFGCIPVLAHGEKLWALFVE
jgi:hypothetical protein